MTDQVARLEKLNSMVKIVDAFSNLLSSKSFPDIQLAMNCAKNVENLYDMLKSRNLLEEFVKYMCKTLHQDESVYDITFHQFACDVILETILTDSSTQTSKALHCANSYISLCGKVRFQHAVSKIIIRSEVCRVLLDLVATTVEDSEISKVFQANLLLKSLTGAGDETTAMRLAHDWVKSEDPFHMAVAFQAIAAGGWDHPASKALLECLTSVLEDRQQSAVHYWLCVMSNPTCISVLKSSKSLFYASLDFLSVTAEKLQFSPQTSWVSQEVGPCHKIGFESLVMYLNYLISADITLAQLVHLFLKEKRSAPGCSLWEEITLKLSN